MKGITHAGVWAAMSSLIAHNTEPELRPSTQGFLQGIHHGFGKFCGAVFGGMLIKERGNVYHVDKQNKVKNYYSNVRHNNLEPPSISLIMTKPIFCLQERF